MNHPETPVVSVVIPTCNRAKLVLRSIRSALAQTLSNIEVIVVVDGPDWETVRALSKIQDMRLQTIALGNPVGGAEARNVGVRRGSGEFVALLDDDDEWQPDKLKMQLDLARTCKDQFPVVTTRLIARRPIGDEIWPSRQMREGESMSEYLLCREASIRGGEGFIQTSTLFVPRALMLLVPFQTGLPRHQDWDWLIRVATYPGVRFLWVWQALVIYYIDGYRKSVSAGPALAPSIEWVDRNSLVTSKARAYFYATQIAVRCRSFEVFWSIVRRTIRYPRAFAIAMGLALIPSSLVYRARLMSGFRHA